MDLRKKNKKGKNSLALIYHPLLQMGPTETLFKVDTFNMDNFEPKIKKIIIIIMGSGQRAEAAANPKNKKPRAPQHVWDL